MSLLPIFLKLDQRRCLVVGAGEVATGKIESLVASEAQVTVVAPWAKPEVMRLAERGAILWHRRAFIDTDLDGQFVVIAGTDRTPVNQHVYRLCREAGILCNAVDDIPHCDFYYGSVVQRGDLQIAISTAGDSPSLAQRLRREIDAQLPTDLGPWLHTIGRLRREVLEAYPADEHRKHLLQQLALRETCAAQFCPSRQVVLPQVPPAQLPLPVLAIQDRPAESQVSVWLVGAGPGDPDLLTLKAARLIASADLILHDDLVPDAILAMAAGGAELVNVGKRCGRASITQAGIHALMIESAHAARRVVRLKSGDPLLFGRANEEMDALREAGVSFAIVSGVTAASAAAAAMPCSLTDRRATSSVLLTTAHTADGEPDERDPTRVVYMPGRDLSRIAYEWRKQGLPGDYPCVLVSRAGQPDQTTTYTTLSQLHTTSPGAAPSLLMGGNAFATHSLSDHSPAPALTHGQDSDAGPRHL